MEAAALFAVGVIAGGAVVYSTRKTLAPPPKPKEIPPRPGQPPSTTFRKDVILAEPSEGLCPLRLDLIGRV